MTAMEVKRCAAASSTLLFKSRPPLALSFASSLISFEGAQISFAVPFERSFEISLVVVCEMTFGPPYNSSFGTSFSPLFVLV